MWLFNKEGDYFKGSARSIAGFDVTEAMMNCGDLFHKFGGHAAAGGFSFKAENEEKIREALNKFAEAKYNENSDVWKSKITFDCSLDTKLVSLDLAASLKSMKPFGHGFEEPLFEVIAKVVDLTFYKDKETGEPRHTAVTVELEGNRRQNHVF